MACPDFKPGTDLVGVEGSAPFAFDETEPNVLKDHLRNRGLEYNDTSIK